MIAHKKWRRSARAFILATDMMDKTRQHSVMDFYQSLYWRWQQRQRQAATVLAKFTRGTPDQALCAGLAGMILARIEIIKKEKASP